MNERLKARFNHVLQITRIKLAALSAPVFRYAVLGRCPGSDDAAAFREADTR
jgi:hypothetical protein